MKLDNQTVPLKRRIMLTGASSGIGYQAAVRMQRAGHSQIGRAHV